MTTTCVNMSSVFFNAGLAAVVVLFVAFGFSIKPYCLPGTPDCILCVCLLCFVCCVLFVCLLCFVVCLFVVFCVVFCLFVCGCFVCLLFGVFCLFVCCVVLCLLILFVVVLQYGVSNSTQILQSQVLQSYVHPCTGCDSGPTTAN